jgi:hypothetical protein
MKNDKKKKMIREYKVAFLKFKYFFFSLNKVANLHRCKQIDPITGSREKKSP